MTYCDYCHKTDHASWCCPKLGAAPKNWISLTPKQAKPVLQHFANTSVALRALRVQGRVEWYGEDAKVVEEFMSAKALAS